MDFIYSDGGRSKYFKAEHVGDCCVRAICNATGKDYKEVYDALNSLAKTEKTGKRKKKISNSREGVYKKTADKYLKSLGWEWKPTMEIGSGCQVHVRENELPRGNLVLNLSRHFTCVKNGVLYDTYDCSRDGNRCVYGYWYKPCKKNEMLRRERVTDGDFPYSHRAHSEPDTVTFRVSIKLGDKVYDNAEVTFNRSDLKSVVYTYESNKGNWGGGFGE